MSPKRAGPEEYEEEPGGLFAALSRRLDPETSASAAASIRGEKASRMALLALDAIKGAGERGATCWEIATAKGLERDSVSPRIPQLVKLGLVYDSGVRRATNGKRAQIVWMANP